MRFGTGPKKLNTPSVVTMAKNFVKASGRVVQHVIKTGTTPFASDEVIAARRAICEACENWENDARFGLGKCNHPKCGCTRAKRGLITEKCPLGKWDDVDAKYKPQQ
jgi:hypothetical protein